jgi:sialic acid synthase
MFDKKQLKAKPFVIAEVGQNHQGDLDLARDYIKTFALAGADAVKFQTRDNKFLFSEGAYNAPYNSENAFDNVYGLHREKLELKKEWYPILIDDCKKNGVKFMCTPFDEPSLSFLINSGVEILKIASFDLGNIPFINKIAKSGLPVVISIGGGKFDQIQSSVEELLKYLTPTKVSILHCVSEYPCTADKLGLNNIENLQTAFPDIAIGLSDHFNGILSGPVGFMKGANIFEKHVTLNRSWKGTDHSFALEPDGFKKFVRDIHRVNQMMEPKPVSDIGNEAVFKKLGKSIVASKNLNAGDILTVDNLSGKIFENQYIPVRESKNILGKTIKVSLSMGSPITFDNIL